MTSPARVFAILELFSEEMPLWHTDDINRVLGYSRATGYRYVKDLVEAGFLQRISAGRYALGARIIQLDFQLRRSDPVLLAAVPVMEETVRKTKFDAVLTAIYGPRVVDTFRASGDTSLRPEYGRGRPRPLFLGAAPKVLLAHLPKARQLKIYDAHESQIAVLDLGNTWEEFRAVMARIRRDGFYVSRGELEEGVGAAAVPLFNAEGDAVAALALVGTTDVIATVGEDRLKARLMRAKDRVERRLAE